MDWRIVIVGVIVNYRRPADTLRSLQSLLGSDHSPLRVILVDQASRDEDDARILTRFAEAEPRVKAISVEHNIGFAAACNLAIDMALSDPSTEAVFLLNNDAFVAPECISRMRAAIDIASRRQMVAAAMYRYDATDEVDSLGIVFYGCGLAANRMSPCLPLLGPCGGAALYEAGMLRDIRATYGEVFDAMFFCYAEDTDLALRARALGYRPAFAATANVLHKGGLTSGGSDSDTVMYYGLRNSFITLIQSMPAGYFYRHFHKMLLLVVSVIVKYARQGRLRMLGRIVRDVLRAAPRALRKRRKAAGAGLLAWVQVRDGIDSRFYERAYLHSQLAALWRRRARSE